MAGIFQVQKSVIGTELTKCCSGPVNCRILGKYRAQGQQGYYTSRNGLVQFIAAHVRKLIVIADTYAFFALANYIIDQRGEYVAQRRLFPSQCPSY